MEPVIICLCCHSRMLPYVNTFFTEDEIESFCCSHCDCSAMYSALEGYTFYFSVLDTRIRYSNGELSFRLVDSIRRSEYSDLLISLIEQHSFFSPKEFITYFDGLRHFL